MATSVVISILVLCLAQQIVCQDVISADVRTGGDGGNAEAGSQPRTIYGPRHLSPHRMMHFGKRPETAPAPVIAPASGVYDLQTYPYLLSVDSQRLRAAPEVAPQASVFYSYERPAADLGFISDEQQQARPFNGVKFMRMMKSDDDSSSDDQSGGEGSSAISVSGRSVPMIRGTTLNLPKAFISTLLYRPTGSAPGNSFASYNKKAEPKNNQFMHFGKK